MLRWAPIMLVLVAGATIGLAWPMSPAPVPGSLSEISLTKNSDGQFYLDAEVNGRSTHFLVDTGASEIALSEADARAAGIAINPSKYELLGEGASGVVRGQHVTIARLEVQGIGEEHVDAVVVPGTSVSLLGQPFLDKLDEIVIRKDHMSLRYSASAAGE